MKEAAAPATGVGAGAEHEEHDEHDGSLFIHGGKSSCAS